MISDVEEFNLNKDKKEISLLETSRREEMEKDEIKREARKAARENNGPLLDDSDALADASGPVEASVDADDDANEEDDDQPLIKQILRRFADAEIKQFFRENYSASIGEDEHETDDPIAKCG